jgi:hypothetical protein
MAPIIPSPPVRLIVKTLVVGAHATCERQRTRETAEPAGVTTPHQFPVLMRRIDASDDTRAI